MKICFLVSLVLLVDLTTNREVDYFWKDYDGGIPSDAFVAGIARSGRPIYIGQGFFSDKGLLPGTLHPSSTDLRVTANDEVFITTINVKILCIYNWSKHKLYWKPINYNDISLLTNQHVVSGGQEANADVYIGRALHQGSTEIGKVYSQPPGQGLRLPNTGETESYYQNFDLLLYNFSAEASVPYECRPTTRALLVYPYI